MRKASECSSETTTNALFGQRQSLLQLLPTSLRLSPPRVTVAAATTSPGRPMGQACCAPEVSLLSWLSPRTSPAVLGTCPLPGDLVPRPTPLPSCNPQASHLTDSILCIPLALSLWFLRNPTSPTLLDWRVVLFHRATVPSDFPTVLDRPSIMTARPTSSTSTSSEASARAPSERFVLLSPSSFFDWAGVWVKGGERGKALLSLRAFRWQSQHSRRTERM